MQITFNGLLAEQFKKRYAEIKAAHPDLPNRAIIAQIRRETPGIRRQAERMGFDLNRWDYAYGKAVR